jgi:MerR family transcriptional regulator/heat shock protein HspR
MSPKFIARDEVAEHLSVTTAVLRRYEARGLVHPIRQGELEGYGASEVGRLWTIVTFQRDLGVNLAGVEAILKLRDHLDDVHRRIAQLAADLNTALDETETDD